MNSTKIIFWVVFVAFCCLPQCHSLKCFVCQSKETCKKPDLYECNPTLANSTRVYLQNYHNQANSSATSKVFDCFQEHLYTIHSNVYYKGCIYSNTGGCHSPIKPVAFSVINIRECGQCNEDGCNSAGRIIVDIITIFTTIIIAFILKH